MELKRTEDTKDAMIQSLKSLMKGLEGENKQLKEQLKSFHAKLYEKI